MTSIPLGGFSKNHYAVLSQPLSLVIVLIVLTAIIIVLIFSLKDLIEQSDIHRIEQQIQVILIEATTMFEHADDGSRRILQVTFPTSLRFIVFGYLPENNTCEPLIQRLDENTSNNCYYVLDDGAIRVFHSNARFSDRTMTKNAVFYPGTYTITLELHTLEGKTYVTMS